MYHINVKSISKHEYNIPNLSSLKEVENEVNDIEKFYCEVLHYRTEEKTNSKLKLINDFDNSSILVTINEK